MKLNGGFGIQLLFLSLMCHLPSINKTAFMLGAHLFLEYYGLFEIIVKYCPRLTTISWLSRIVHCSSLEVTLWIYHWDGNENLNYYLYKTEVPISISALTPLPIYLPPPPNTKFPDPWGDWPDQAGMRGLSLADVPSLTQHVALDPSCGVWLQCCMPG